MQFAEPLGTADSSVDAGWDYLRERWHPKLIDRIRELDGCRYTLPAACVAALEIKLNQTDNQSDPYKR